MKVIIGTEYDGVLWERTANEAGEVVIVREDRALLDYLATSNTDVIIKVLKEGR